MEMYLDNNEMLALHIYLEKDLYFEESFDKYNKHILRK